MSRKNIDEALSKLQVIIDAAVEAITPKEVDPETKKRVEKQIKAGQQARLDNKKKASAKKKERSNKNWD